MTLNRNFQQNVNSFVKINCEVIVNLCFSFHSLSKWNLHKCEWFHLNELQSSSPLSLHKTTLSIQSSIQHFHIFHWKFQGQRRSTQNDCYLPVLTFICSFIARSISEHVTATGIIWPARMCSSMVSASSEPGRFRSARSRSPADKCT